MDLRRVMTIDPGVGGTGIAFWISAYTVPVPAEVRCLRPHTAGSWASRAMRVVEQYEDFLAHCEPLAIYIEEPAVWFSPKGLASAEHGDILKLSQLIGMLILATLNAGYKEPTMLPVQKWKGQLPKRVVVQRIKKLTRITYPDHTADAVGMGMYLLGRL